MPQAKSMAEVAKAPAQAADPLRPVAAGESESAQLFPQACFSRELVGWPASANRPAEAGRLPSAGMRRERGGELRLRLRATPDARRCFR